MSKPWLGIRLCARWGVHTHRGYGTLVRVRSRSCNLRPYARHSMDCRSAFGVSHRRLAPAATTEIRLCVSAATQLASQGTESVDDTPSVTALDSTSSCSVLSGAPAPSAHLQGSVTPSEATRVKMGKPRPEEVRAKISASLTGRSRPDAVRAKIAAARKGRKLSEATKAKIAAARRGRTQATETKEKIRKSMTGRQHALATRYKMAVSGTGRVYSEEAVARRTYMHRASKPAQAKKKQAQAGAAAAMGADSASGIGAVAAPPDPARRWGAALSNPLVLERAVAELVTLRREVMQWMDAYASMHGQKPSMEDASRVALHMYDKFVRVIALREFVRRHSSD